MTRDEARKNAEVMLAYAEGKRIRHRAFFGQEKWTYTKGTRLLFLFDKCEYEIAPEPLVKYAVVSSTNYIHDLLATYEEARKYADSFHSPDVRVIKLVEEVSDDV